MQLYSTNNKNELTDLKTAVLNGQAPDGGLYMPVEWPNLLPAQLEELKTLSFNDLATKIASLIFEGELEESVIERLINDAYDFSAAIHKLNDKLYSLELFHGPSLAFKDFGAGFMARLMSYYITDDNRELNILVATSGDTGGAVASAFFEVPGISVTILYPSAMVSETQEKHLTTWGGNIKAIEVQGTFDDCQKMVKQAFADQDLREKVWLSSANSINIARLIPQTFYYFSSFCELNLDKITYCVPSGNFGNLTAGMIAKKMGLPVNDFIAATNVNRVIPDYLESSEFQPREAIATISNAIDIGNPSNFIRIMELYGNDYMQIKNDLTAYSISDEETMQAMREAYEKYNYVLDPHGAVAYLASNRYLEQNDTNVVFLETAHPAKFVQVVEKVLENTKVEIPDALAKHIKREKEALLLDASYQSLKEVLLDSK